MKRRTPVGFSLIELLVVIAIAGVLAGIAIPITTNAMKGYRLQAAASAIAGAIQSTRYAEIMHGYPGTTATPYGYQITFTPATNSYQVYTMIPPATTFSAVVNMGGTLYNTRPLPIARVGDVTINRTATFQFGANGTVNDPAGIGTIQITNVAGCALTIAAGCSKTIIVSTVGNVAVKSP